MLRKTICFAVLALLAPPVSAIAESTTPAAPPPLLTPADGVRITRNTKLKPGVYVLGKGIEVAADGVTLDGEGAVLIGRDFTGCGIHASGRKGLVLKNLTVQRWYHGIRLEDCTDITIEDSAITHTAEVGFGNNWLNIWATPEEAYGAGIILINVRGGRIRGNDLQHQQNGISMYSCSGLTVEKNNASYESGWGIHLYSSSDNILQDNTADFCSRVHERGSYDYVGADAAGLLMVYNSCRNKVLRNNFRCGGDGVFIAGYRAPGEIVPCNDNVFEGNDCSLSPNNAFESTFCEGNVFRKNRANGSNYGFWLGYSWKNVVSDNTIYGNRFAGVAIEHGNTNRITGNRISNNRYGVLLWTRREGSFLDDFPKLADSHTCTIQDNKIVSNRVGIDCFTGSEGKPRCHNNTITGNTITDNRIGIRFERVIDSQITDNLISGNSVEDIRLIESPGNRTQNNQPADPPKGDPDVLALPFEARR